MLIRAIVFLAAAVAAAAASDVTGNWNATARLPDGEEHKVQMVLKSDGGKLAGSLESEQGPIELRDVQLKGDELTYTIEVSGEVIPMKLTVAGNQMKGTLTLPGGATGAFSATRQGEQAGQSGGVAGKWTVVAKSSSGTEHNLQLELREDNGKISGTLTAPNGSVELQNARREGSRFTFQLPLDEGTYSVKLTVDSGAMSGTFTGPGGETGSIEAKR